MALRLSSGLRNFLLEGGSMKRAFDGGKLLVYSGSQVATADAAVAGTLLCTYTVSSGAHTAEVLPLGVVTLSYSGTGTGTVDTFTVNSLEIMGSATASNLATIDLVAAAVVDKINNNPKNLLFMASSAAGVITITGKPGLGSLYNTKALACSCTAGDNTMASAITSTTFGSGTGGGTAGIDALNGLRFGNAAAGVLVKDPSQTWSGVAAADGTAGWFRLQAAVADAGAIDAAELYIRLDGNVATSGANMNVSSTTYATGATQTQATFSITEPAA